MSAEEHGKSGDRPTVFLLGRYRDLDPEHDGLRDLARRYPALDLEFSIAHSSKGLEADFGIVLALEEGRFPARDRDDPVLELVMPRLEDFLHAEERRLFYVALTRARHACYLLPDAESPSPFVDEVLHLGEKHAFHVVVMGDRPSLQVACPICGGRVRRRGGSNGDFDQCSNGWACPYKREPCGECQAQVLGPSSDEGLARCPEETCDYVEYVCSCGQGSLQPRQKKDGSPYGRCTVRKKPVWNWLPMPCGRGRERLLGARY